MKIKNTEIYCYTDRKSSMMEKRYFLPAIVLESYGYLDDEKEQERVQAYYLIFGWWKWNFVIRWEKREEKPSDG